MQIELGWAEVLDTLVRDPADEKARAWADEAAREERGTPGQLYSYRVLTSGEEVLTALAEGPRRVEALLAEYAPTRTDHQPEPGEWSPRQIVHHLADNEAVNAVRLRAILTEETPEIYGYDSDPWTRFFDVESVPEALHRFAVQRANTVRVLRGLSDEDFDRKGVLSYRGAETVRVLAAVLAGHDLSHLDQLVKSFTMVRAAGL
ncbi:DinB family protein [Amycolatopsis sulphurea]|uniref:DinB family protein n=1 Tax=Amycolatopsis sulphurea TaxID=76022 RepID=A0A2A9G3B7_9PSEU|nr:DinB family protein [Amycolatopsis sulphurea]PFG57235.1 DinB family protein [Amycolatopsis sulphurea]